jgi:hypothetical protein
MIFEQCAIKEMLTFYSTLVGTNTSPEEEKLLFEELKIAVYKIDPTFDLGVSLTSYEAFLLVDNMTPKGNINIENHEIDGFFDAGIEFMPWDPQCPVDDTQQYPDSEEECVPRSLEPSIPCDVPLREDHEYADFFQGEDIAPAATEEFNDVSLFEMDKLIIDTEQMPEEHNVSLVDRSAFSNDHAGRDFV